MANTRQLGPDALLDFNKQLRGVVQAGIPLDQGLESVARALSHDRLRAEIDRVVGRIRQGLSLSDALRESGGAFPESYISVIAAGEAAGSLVGILEQMVRHYRRQCAFRSTFITIISYPLGVLVPAALIVGLLLIFVVPLFTDIYGDLGAELPPSTAALMDLSDLCRLYWPHAILAVVALFLFWWFSVRNTTSRDWRVLRHVPIFSGLYRSILSASFLSIMGMLTRAGVPLVQALRLSQAALIGRKARAQIAAACQRLEQGERASDVLGDLSFVPPLTATMLRLGADRNDLGQLMLESADFYESEAEFYQTRAVGITEPLLIVLLGVVVGFCIIALYLPFFSNAQVLR